MGDQADPESIVSPAERIKELNSIDQDVVDLIRAAGLAIKTLSPISPLPQEGDDAPQQSTADERKAAFTTSTANYFRLLDSISVRLKRQIYALEEADILPSENESSVSEPAAAGAGAAQAAGGRKGLSASGLGNLDISWLNSRSDVVGKRMEAELWAKARSFLEKLDRDREGTSDDTGDTTEGTQATGHAQDDDVMRP